MSFMFRPLAYDDPNAFNVIQLDPKEEAKFNPDTVSTANAIIDEMSANGKRNLAIDGYISADYDLLNEALGTAAENKGIQISFLSMRKLYKSKSEIDSMTEENLPENYDDDPVLLFGRLYKGTMNDFVADDAADHVKAFFDQPGLHIVYGIGAACPKLRDLYDAIGYNDVTPKVCAIRAREQKYANIGDETPRPFKALMRRNYYVDFEVAVKLRKELLLKDLIDYYILGSDTSRYQMMPRELVDHVLATLVEYPFRAKPVYMEGIWGGEYIRKLRHIPMDIASNIAWIFEFIPMEVSIEVMLQGVKADIPFSTFLAKEGEAMMGSKCYQEFDGYFPVRFNYDDTWHSNGNMSIQCHPGEDFIIENYDEFGRQDEAYYVIATGHGARTYIGFRKDGHEFLKLAEASEKDHKDIDYQQYVNSVVSYPGRQVMIPAGTIHASGRNQFILELGSLTIGSYTYKMYDYNRIDSDGNPRPIHTKNAEKVLHFERDSKWVDQNVAIEPIPYRSGKGYEEYIVGSTELMYYETHRVEMGKGAVYEDRNDRAFTVITLVDGESVRISSKKDPAKYYDLKYCEIATIPNTIDEFVVENTGYQPCVLHKTILREGYSRYQNRKYESR
jgi:mannose-6-phosphate isomerase class I